MPEVKTVPMGQLFSACRDVLLIELRPIHYPALTELAVGHLGMNAEIIDMKRAKEDVREKLLETRSGNVTRRFHIIAEL